MGIKSQKPTSPGRRFQKYSTFQEITRKRPEKSLVRKLKKTGGTTGDALSFYIEKGKWIANHVAYNRIFMERAGYNRRKKTVSILGMKKESKF